MKRDDPTKVEGESSGDLDSNLQTPAMTFNPERHTGLLAAGTGSSCSNRAFESSCLVE